MLCNIFGGWQREVPLKNLILSHDLCWLMHDVRLQCKYRVSIKQKPAEFSQRGSGGVLWYLMPLSTIFQFYRDWSVLLVEETKVHRENLPQVTEKLYHIMLYRVHLVWTELKLTTLVVIGTGCIGSYKSNYHMITTMTAPEFSQCYP